MAAAGSPTPTPELVQRPQDVGVAPQQTRDQHAEHQNHERRYNDKSDHRRLLHCGNRRSSIHPRARRKRFCGGGTARYPAGSSAAYPWPWPATPETRTRDERNRNRMGDDLFLPEPEPTGAALHGDLGRRPRRRAGAHLRGPPAQGAPGPGPSDRGDGGGAPGVGVRGGALHPGRHERRGRAAPGDLRPRAVPLRPDAPGLLRRRGPGTGHGHQRGVGVGELPLADHRLLRPGLLLVPRP